MSAHDLFATERAWVLAAIKAALKEYRPALGQATGVLPGRQLPTTGNTGTGYTPVPADASTQGGVQLAHDLGGTSTAPLVVGLQDRPLAATAPATGQALVWSGTAWAPDTVGGGGGSLPWFDVTAYGALGDGTTDDTAAVSGAISALTSDGRGVLYFPAGQYKTSGGFTLSVPCMVLGDGAGSFDDAERISAVLCTSATAVLFTVTAKTAHFSRMSLINTAGSTPSAGSAILCDGSYLEQRVDYEHLHIKRFYDNLDIKVGAQWTMHNCLVIAPIRYGVRVRNTVNNDAGDWVIDSCFFNPEATDPTSALRIESGGGGKIANCKFNTAAPGNTGKFGRMIDLDCVSISAPTSILLVSNCSIENYTGDGIHLVGPDWTQIIIHGCQWGQYGNGTGRAIYASDTTDLIIDACHFRCDSAAAAAIVLSSITRAYIGAATNNGYTAILSQSGSTGVIDLSGGALTNPLTTAGDLIVGGSGGSLGRLGVGSAAQVLTSVAGAPAWAAPTGGGSWSVLTNGDAASPELIFASGDVVMVFTA